MSTRKALVRGIIILGIVSLAFLAGCGGGAGQSVNNQPPQPTAVTVSPASATVTASGVQQFAAVVTPSGANQAVTWSLSGTGCTGASCGTIDATGRYTAAATVPNPPTVTVVATSVADPSKTGPASVTIIAITPPVACSNPNNAKLNGQYAFLFSGFDGDSSLAIAGSFTADGNGHITAGVQDINTGLTVTTDQAFTGAYLACPDNRGSMTLQLARGTSTFSFALASFASGVAGRGRLVSFGDVSQTGFIGTGVLARQDPAAFSTAAVNGGFAFGFGGEGSRGTFLLSANGRFTTSGGSLSAGQIDVNDGGTTALNLPFAGTYTVGANGRGTAVLNITAQSVFSNFSFYVVSAGELLFVELDQRSLCPCPVISGSALQQSGVPFAASSLSGAAVFNLNGVVSPPGTDVAVGQETFDGSGSLSGAFDENKAGVITSSTASTGTYTVDGNGLGRGVITITGDPNPMPFYLVSPGKGFIINAGSSGQAGIFEPQTGGPFSNASVSGNYVLGTPPSLFALSAVSGVVAANGVGSLNGTSDGGGGTGQSFTGSYSVAANGRATLAITPSVGAPRNMVFYLVSPSEAVGIQVDSGATNAAVNIIEK